VFAQASAKRGVEPDLSQFLCKTIVAILESFESSYEKAFESNCESGTIVAILESFESIVKKLLYQL
jgi:hypothetical protein